MDTSGLADLRARLESDRGRLRGEIAELRDYAVKATTYLEDETEVYDNHPADEASSLVGRQTDMVLLRNLEQELSDVESALTRMDGGRYGSCEVCGRPIAPKRLEARPAATTCIGCQRSIESRRRRDASTQASAGQRTFSEQE
jgi:RNA polymerase-binding protein DksA